MFVLDKFGSCVENGDCNMVLIDSKKYDACFSFANDCRCGKVYPLSIVQLYQQGDVFTKCAFDWRTVLFWHYSGFAFIVGEYDEEFLGMIYKMISEKNSNNRRFILFNCDKRIDNYFVHKENVAVEKRCFFEYNENINAVVSSTDYQVKVIDAESIKKIKGRITPAFSWDNMDDFLMKGKGYCIAINGEIAAWAFSAAISDKEIDIGVETNEKYQGMGLATVVSKAMLKYILREKKIPVWACHFQNIASAKLAEKLGFKKIKECSVIKISK